MDAIHEKVPRVKMPNKASFSRPGRRMLSSNLMGRMRIQMSITMLVELVTGRNISCDLAGV